MKLIQQVFIFLIMAFSFITVNAQEKKKLKGAQLEANQYVFDGNTILTGEKPNILSAEKNYRRAIAKDEKSSTARYNLGVSHYATKNHQEAADRFKQAAKVAKNEGEKNVAYYNEGNAYMELQKFDEAIESYKNALRNNPYDNDARKNLAIAKKMKEQQDKNKDQNKDQKDNKDDNKEEDKDKNSDDKKKGDDDNKKEDKDSDDKKDEEEDGKKDDEEDSKDKDDDPKGDGKDEKEGDQGKDKRPVEGKLSPDQVKSLLDAMADEEKKVQDKMNAKKVKGARVKSEKDW